MTDKQTNSIYVESLYKGDLVGSRCPPPLNASAKEYGTIDEALFAVPLTYHAETELLDGEDVPTGSAPSSRFTEK
jgi:hypothetical protein